MGLRLCKKIMTLEDKKGNGMGNPLYDRLFGIHSGKTTTFLHLPDGQTLSHAAFLDKAARLANALTGLGLEPGDRVAVRVEKTPEALALYAACAQAGLIFLPLNTAYTTHELTYFIENSGASLVVCDSKDAEDLNLVAKAQNARLETLDADGSGSLMRRALGMLPAFAPVSRSEDDLAALLYTSGTTGRSKGAMLTQANLLSNALTLVHEWRFTDKDVLLHALPTFHTHGLFVATNVVLASGGSMIFCQSLIWTTWCACCPPRRR